MQSEPVSSPSVAVAIPAYNEAEGIGGFLTEIDRAVAGNVASLRLIVVDDASTDNTREVVQSIGNELRADLELVVNSRNLGHGPTVLVGYRQAVQSGADLVLQVDGDGQFLGSDLRRLLVLLVDQAHAVSGVRRFRQDPWFRMVMTTALRTYVRQSFGVSARDPNCPLRGYEAPLLAELLGDLPDSCLIPNLYLTVLAASRGLALVEVDVSHRVRRGGSSQGTSWTEGRSPVPLSLVRFSARALIESRRFRRGLQQLSQRPT
ncbi:MAG TPA: glycosyltransferase family 2 protein [Solirubrobacteraceae bacterium]|nr:glycosyltransferase family 2 protein [Solirubrobacteraceae bacterium]